MKGGIYLFWSGDMAKCECGGTPVLIWHYIKGTANHVNYFARCGLCRARTRNRKLPSGAVEDWNTGVSIYRPPAKKEVAQ